MLDILIAARQAECIIADHVAGVERTAWPEVLAAVRRATVGLYCYRWQEGNAEPCEVWGKLRDLAAVALKLELPERPFRAELFDADGNQTTFDVIDGLAAIEGP